MNIFRQNGRSQAEFIKGFFQIVQKEPIRGGLSLGQLTGQWLGQSFVEGMKVENTYTDGNIRHDGLFFRADPRIGCDQHVFELDESSFQLFLNFTPEGLSTLQGEYLLAFNAQLAFYAKVEKLIGEVYDIPGEILHNLIRVYPAFMDQQRGLKKVKGGYASVEDETALIAPSHFRVGYPITGYEMYALCIIMDKLYNQGPAIE